MKKAIGGIIIGAGLLVSVACGSGGSESALIADYAACMADESRPLNALVQIGHGGPFTVDEAVVMVQADLDSGKNTLADIEAAMELYCR